jgi:methylated-DNA-[protein]-cysteine S-methyltransferase
MEYTFVDSPVGRLMLAGDTNGLRILSFADSSRAMPAAPGWRLTKGGFSRARAELDAYFRGQLRQFTVPLLPEGTAFQRQVWSGLCEIPYGATVSYGELATRLGNSKAVRAVGLANGANPIAIIIPCHRVIGSTGTLIGYGGGLSVKKALLDLERGARKLW